MKRKNPGRSFDPANRPVERSFVILDIEKSSGRTNLQLLEFRKRLYQVLNTLMTHSSWSRDRWVAEDRGDGVMVIADVSVIDLLELLTTTFLELLHKDNEEVSSENWMRLRVGLHRGFVHRDEYGWVGDALTETFRIVNDHRVKKEFALTDDAHAVVVVSNLVYSNVIRHGYVGDVAEYRPLKGKGRPGWLRICRNATVAD